MNIKTITTIDGVNEVDFGSSASRFYWFKNIGTTAVHVSGNADIVAGSDGVAELAAGDSVCIETLGGKVYVLGEGKVQIHNSGDKFCPFKLAPAQNGGGVAVCNDNLLINPDFKINQREKSGTIIPNKNADGEDIHTYFVDRWGIDSGSVTINADGTLTLNGTMSQILENAVGTNITASVSAGSAVYDDVTKTFTVTGNGDVISWAKLEHGKTATAFIQPEPATELLKCMRYYEIIMSADCDRAMPANLRPDLKVEMDFQFKIPKRAIPSLATDTLRFVVGTPTGYSTSNLSVQQFASDINGMCLATVDPVLPELPTYLLSVTVDTWRLGAFAVDAEIYLTGEA